MNSPGGRRSVPASALLLVLLGILAYAGSLGGRFLYDDIPGIVENPSLRSLRTALLPPAGGLPESGRPLLNLTFALNYAAGGLSPWGYHAANLAIHLAAALLLYGIVRRTAEAMGLGAARLAALAVAGLWMLHPLQTESVAYVSQRAESLMGLFYLLALYAFIRGRPGLSWLACLCGMACKEVMVTAPLLILLYDRTFVAGSFREAWRRRRRYYLALAATWVPLAALVAANGGRAGTAGFGSDVSVAAYAATQVRAVAHYLRLALWPAPLLGDYGRALAGAGRLFLEDGLLLLALAASALWGLAADPSSQRRRAAWGFLGAAFFLILAPSSSVVPIATETVAEHRMYLPLAAVLAAVLLAGAGALAGLAPRRRTALAGLAAFVLAAAAGAEGAASALRNRAYRDGFAFWSDVAAKDPGNAGAHNNLGNIYADGGNLPAAEAEYRWALRLAPEYDDAQVGLGNVLVRRGLARDALPHYRLALRYRPDDPSILHAYAAALVRASEPEEAARAYQRIAALRPDDGEAWYRLAVLFSSQGQADEALRAADAAVRLRPGFADARVTRADLLAQLGRRGEAIAEYQAALRLAPAAPDVRNNLGGLLAEAGRLPEAEAQLEEALREKPDYAAARQNLDWVRAQERRGGER
ncbi:MAG TPA: tetratricopeptide repeat protein [Opitutaceae bacterium]|nr:tetratricopeptide repeat protein [Opitutaceae bacterium]